MLMCAWSRVIGSCTVGLPLGDCCYLYFLELMLVVLCKHAQNVHMLLIVRGKLGSHLLHCSLLLELEPYVTTNLSMIEGNEKRASSQVGSHTCLFLLFALELSCCCLKIAARVLQQDISNLQISPNQQARSQHTTYNSPKRSNYTTDSSNCCKQC